MRLFRMAPRLLMKPLMAVMLILAQQPFASADPGSTIPSAKELYFLTWADYIDPEVVQAFERKFNTKLRQVHFETDDARDSMLAETDGRGYDVVLVSEQIGVYRQRGWVSSLTEKDIPNLKHIDPRWINAFPPAAGYGVPYVWGNTGIAYRTDLVPEKITSWKQLFQPAEALRGKIMMIKNAQQVARMALKALGYSMNSTDPRELAQAESLMLAQKPYVKSYAYPPMTADFDLVTGQIAVAMLYNGDALKLRAFNANIAYVTPDEGSDFWIDYLAVLQSSPRKPLAMDFINFLHEPENAARIARFIYYATPNKAAEKLLPPEFLQDPIIYPGEAVLKKSEFYVEFSPRIAKKFNSIFARLTE